MPSSNPDYRYPTKADPKVLDRLDRMAEKGHAESLLTTKQLAVLEALLTKRDETLQEIADKCGITYRTLHRYMRLPAFQNEYRIATRLKLQNAAGMLSDSLIAGARDPGNGQAAMQKLFWQLAGYLSGDNVNVGVGVQIGVDNNGNGNGGNGSGSNGRNSSLIDVGPGSGTMIVPVEKLPLEMKIKLLEIIEAEQREREIEQRRVEEDSRIEQAKKVGRR